MKDIPDYIKNRYWKDYLPLGMSLEIDIPDDVNFVDFYMKAIEKCPDKVATVYYGVEVTFQEQKEKSIRFANALLSLGIKQGDVVALWLPNSPQFATCYYGAFLIGATLTAISPLFVAREMSYQIKDSGAKILIMLDRFFRQYKKMKDELQLEKVILVNIICC